MSFFFFFHRKHFRFMISFELYLTFVLSGEPVLVEKLSQTFASILQLNTQLLRLATSVARAFLRPRIWQLERLQSLPGEQNSPRPWRKNVSLVSFGTSDWSIWLPDRVSLQIEHWLVRILSVILKWNWDSPKRLLLILI